MNRKYYTDFRIRKSTHRSKTALHARSHSGMQSRITSKGSTLVRHLILLVGGICFVMAAWIGCMEYATHALNARKDEIEATLRKEIGFPLHFSSIESRWRGGKILVEINDVVLDDVGEPVPFLSSKKLTLGTSPLRFLFHKEKLFNQLTFEGMKIVVGWSHQKKMTVLGLQGEWLPSEFEYETLLKSLTSQESIALKNSEIVWRGPDIIFQQTLNGKLSWLDPQALSWIFEGKQQLKINEGVPLPNSPITLLMDGKAKVFTLKTALERSKIQGKIFFPTKEINPEAIETSSETTPPTPEKDGENTSLQKEGTQNEVIRNDVIRNDVIKIEGDVVANDLDLQMIHESVLLHENNSEWARWLVTSLEKGKITQGTFNLHGPLNDLEWTGKVAFRNVDLRYTQGWPKVKKAEGKVFIKKDHIDVEVYEGKIQGTPLKKVTAVIAPLENDPYSTVVVEGSLHGKVEKGLKFLESSPLRETTLTHLSHLKPTGEMDLDLKLNVPLGQASNEEKKPVTVQGKVEVTDGQVMIEDLDLPITEIEGTFLFTEAGVTAKEVTGGLFDKPLKIEVTPTEVKTTTLITTDFLNDRFSSEYLKYLQGQSEMSIAYSIESGEWIIASDLKGMAVDLPYPFGKEADTPMPVQVFLPPTTDEYSKVGLHVQGLLDAKWVLEQKNDAWALKRGHMAFGSEKKSDWTSAEALLINGEMPELKVDEWKTFLARLEHVPTTLPIQINVLMQKMEAFGLTLKNTWLTYNSGKHPSEWFLDGPLLKGSLHLPSENNKRMQFDLDYLKLVSTHSKEEETSAIAFLKGKDRIPLVFNCKSLVFNDAWFGEISFRLEPKPHGYNIEDLNSRTHGSTLMAHGEWRLNENGENTVLQGEVVSDNMSRTFSQWGFNSSMRESKGRIQFNLSWPTSPFELNLKTTTGEADVKLRSGRIVGVDPGLGKILGLLSVDSLSLIRRRLQLDFSDVVKKGFVFDTLEGNFHFQHGLAETQNLTIDGPAAKIKISGAANLKTKGLDLDMTVAPKVSGTLPIAATLATGNPAVGFGVLVFDKIMGSPLSRATQHRYHVTGTWDAPHMQEQGVSDKRRR